jgi:hypothetical protein
MLVLPLIALSEFGTAYAAETHGAEVDDNLLQYLSSLGWGHINLTGDYVWQKNKQPKKGKFRPLRPFSIY